MLTLFGIGYRFIQTPLRAAQRTSANVQPSAVQAHHRKAETIAFRAYAIGHGHATIFENHLRGGRGIPAKLFLRRAKAKPCCVLVDDKATNALCFVIAGADHDNIDVIISSARDELLRAIQHIMIAIAPRAGFQRRSIRPAAGFREAIACNFLHRHKLRQITRLQLCIAEAINHPRGHIMNGNKCAGGGAAIGHSLHDQRRLQPAKARATRFFGHINRAKAKRACRFPHIYRIMRLFVPFGGKRRDRICGEFARHVLYGDLIVGEFKLVLHKVAVASTS